MLDIAVFRERLNFFLEVFRAYKERSDQLVAEKDAKYVAVLQELAEARAIIAQKDAELVTALSNDAADKATIDEQTARANAAEANVTSTQLLLASVESELQKSKEDYNAATSEVITALQNFADTLQTENPEDSQEPAPVV